MRHSSSFLAPSSTPTVRPAFSVAGVRLGWNRGLLPPARTWLVMLLLPLMGMFTATYEILLRPTRKVYLAYFLIALGAGVAAWLNRKEHRFDRVITGIVIWASCAVPFIFYTYSSLSGVILDLILVVIVPIAFFVVGYLGGRRVPEYLVAVLLVSGVLSLLIASVCVFSPENDKVLQGFTHRGYNERVFINWFFPERPLTGTVLAMCCLGVAMANCFLAWPRPLWLRLVALLSYVGFVVFSMRIGTRAALFASVGGLLCISPYYLRAMLRQRGQGVLIVLFVLSIGAGLWYVQQIVSLYIMQRFDVSALRDASLSGRTGIWMENLQVIARNPMGHGFFISASNEGSLSSHNLFIDMAYTLGAVTGLIALAFFTYAGITASRTLLQGSSSVAAKTFAAAIVTGITVNMFEASIRSCYGAFCLVMLITGAHLSFWWSRQRTDFKFAGRRPRSSRLKAVSIGRRRNFGRARPVVRERIQRAF